MKEIQEFRSSGVQTLVLFANFTSLRNQIVLSELLKLQKLLNYKRS